MNDSIDPSIDLYAEIDRLRKERNAVILAHYYQEPEIQDLADFIGDSLQLSQQAKQTEADVILFCGVHFMAETAKILNPSKMVLIPDMAAGCSLADACPADKLADWKAKHPEHLVVSYINCSAGTKALSDLICTSSNAQKMIESLPADKPILFAPDRNLGAWLIRQTGREMDLWQGVCEVHDTFSERALIALKTRHPKAKVIAHPECDPSLLSYADHVGSTSSLLHFSRDDTATAYIVATEPGIIHKMKQASPEKEFIPLPGQDENCACNECPYMRLNTLEKIYLALRDLKPELHLDEDLRLRALAPLERMLAIS
jgi:quinolinate synthase